MIRGQVEVFWRCRLIEKAKNAADARNVLRWQASSIVALPEAFEGATAEGGDQWSLTNLNARWELEPGATLMEARMGCPIAGCPTLRV